MNKSTKGALAAAAAGALLIGGAGSLAFWTASSSTTAVLLATHNLPAGATLSFRALADALALRDGEGRPDDALIEQIRAGIEDPYFASGFASQLTAKELAALVSVVAALGAAGDAPPRRTSEWAAPHRKVRRPMLPGFVFPGPGAWRASGLPR